MHKAKREFWQNFVEGIEKSSNPTQIRFEDKNRCWIALKYTKPKSNNTTPALIGLNNKIAVIMQDKKALVRLHAFLPPPIFYKTEYKPGRRTAHALVTKDHFGKALLTDRWVELVIDRGILIPSVKWRQEYRKDCQYLLFYS